VMRDVEIFERMAKSLPVSVNLSVPTLDDDAWRATEPHTPSPAARLDAVAELRRRGIDSGVLIAPLMPGINDDPSQVQPIIDRAREANASFLGGVALHLRDEVKDVFFAWLEAKRPDLLKRYEALYRDRAYMRPAQRKQATRAVHGWGRKRSMQPPLPGGGTGGGTTSEDALATAGGGGSPAVTGPAGPTPSQQPLF
jgi:DNA repair photolyase